MQLRAAGTAAARGSFPEFQAQCSASPPFPQVQAQCLVCKVLSGSSALSPCLSRKQRALPLPALQSWSSLERLKQCALSLPPPSPSACCKGRVLQVPAAKLEAVCSLPASLWRALQVPAAKLEAVCSLPVSLWRAPQVPAAKLEAACSLPASLGPALQVKVGSSVLSRPACCKVGSPRRLKASVRPCQAASQKQCFPVGSPRLRSRPAGGFFLVPVHQGSPWKSRRYQALPRPCRTSAGSCCSRAAHLARPVLECLGASSGLASPKWALNRRASAAPNPSG